MEQLKMMPRMGWVVVLVLVGGMVVAWAALDLINPFNDASFDEQEWKQGKNRMAMAEDLQDRYLVRGMTREDVLSLLGPNGAPPDRTDMVSPMLLKYSLGGNGISSLFKGWDSVYLTIYFDDGRLCESVISGT